MGGPAWRPANIEKSRDKKERKEGWKEGRREVGDEEEEKDDEEEENDGASK